MSVKHVVLSQDELDLINRLIEKEKDSIAHLMAIEVLGTDDDKAARRHFFELHKLSHTFEAGF